MKPIVHMVAMIALATGNALAADPAGAVSPPSTTFSILPSLHGVHPRLYISPEQFAEARKSYAADPQAIAAYLPKPDGPELTDRLHPFNENVETQRTAIKLAKLGVAYAFTDDERYLEGIRRWKSELEAYHPPVMRNLGGSEGLTGGHILLGFSIMYDMLKGRVDPATEGMIRKVLVDQAKRTFEDLAKLKVYPYEQNHLIIPACGLAVAAMTLIDEEPEAEKWGALTTDILDKSLQAIAYDGWFFEGFSYWNYTMQFPASYAAARMRTMGDNLFVHSPFKDAAEYLAHMTLPNRMFVFDFADWGPRVEKDGVSFQKGYDWPWHTFPDRVKTFVPYLIWQEGGRDPFLKDYIGHAAPAGNETTGIYTIDAIFGMLLQIPNGAAPKPLKADYEDNPPYHYFPDMDVVHWRSDWSDPDATAIAFKSGPPAGHHFAELLANQPKWKPALGHAHPDAGSFIIFAKGRFLANDTGYTGRKETADHNSILVDGIGQHKGGTAWSTFEGKPYDEYNKIRMENVWLAPSVAAGTAVMADAYENALQLQTLDRDLILVDGRFMVVRDRIASALPHVYEWRLHTDREPKKISADRFEMTNGDGRLLIENLGPVASSAIAPTVVETELSTKRSRPQQRGYHLAVSSEKSAQADFLTAMCIQSAREEAAAVRFTRLDAGKIHFDDGQRTCTVWLSGSAELDGHFAYAIWNQKKELLCVGLKGKALKSPELSLELSETGDLTARKDGDVWKAESIGPSKEMSASVQADQQKPQSILLP